MSIVSKKINGYIYQTDFSTLSSKWEVSDIDRVALNNGLVLKPGSEKLTVMLRKLGELDNFVIDVHNDYNPTKDTETSGILAFKDEMNNVCIEEYYDKKKGTKETYPWLRLMRVGREFTGWGSQNGRQWELIGTRILHTDTPKVGLFLQGVSESNLIKEVIVYRSPDIQIQNVPIGSTFRFKHEDGTIQTYQTSEYYPTIHFSLRGKQMPIKGQFEWESEKGVVESEVVHDVWGGDVYSFGIILDLYYETTPGTFKRVESNVEEFLGYVNETGEGDLTVRRINMRLQNNQQTTFGHSTVKLGAYPNKEHLLPYIKLSDTVDGPYDKTSLDLGIIRPGEYKDFWVEINRVTDIDTGLIEEVYFKLQSLGTIGGAD